jgi:hypothetical protein
MIVRTRRATANATTPTKTAIVFNGDMETERISSTTQKHNKIHLSKGAKPKQHPKAWEYLLVEYETRSDATVENVQQVRAVSTRTKGRWELHIVCTDESETPDALGIPVMKPLASTLSSVISLPLPTVPKKPNCIRAPG